MGKMTKRELMMAAVMILLLTLWIGHSFFSLDGTTTAFVGLSILLLSGVLSWEDIKAEKTARDTLIWFAALLMMVRQIGELGVTNGWVPQSLV